MAGLNRRGASCLRCTRLGRPCGQCRGPKATALAGAATDSSLLTALHAELVDASGPRFAAGLPDVERRAYDPDTVRFCNAERVNGALCMTSTFTKLGRCSNGHLPGEATHTKPAQLFLSDGDTEGLAAERAAHADTLSGDARCHTEEWFKVPVEEVASGAPAGSQISDGVTHSAPVAAKRLGAAFNQASKLTRWDLDGELTAVWATGKQAKGGHFAIDKSKPWPRQPSSRGAFASSEAHEAYQKKVDDWNQACVDLSNDPNRVMPYQIRIVKTPGDTDSVVRNKVFHEIGHATDRRSGVSGIDHRHGASRYVSDAAAKGDTGPGMDEMRAFLDAAAHAPSIGDFACGPLARITSNGGTYMSYTRSPKELWARAFAQWTESELGNSSNPGRTGDGVQHDFTAQEMERLGPMVNNVLKARGLRV